MKKYWNSQLASPDINVAEATNFHVAAVWDTGLGFSWAALDDTLSNQSCLNLTLTPVLSLHALQVLRACYVHRPTVTTKRMICGQVNRLACGPLFCSFSPLVAVRQTLFNALFCHSRNHRGIKPNPKFSPTTTNNVRFDQNISLGTPLVGRQASLTGDRQTIV